MPHQCTNCGETFPDGSKEMLSGCPQCGGNKFQFRPSSSVSEDELADTSAGSSVDSSADTTPDEAAGDASRTDDSSVSETAAKASEAVREWVGFGEPETESDSSSSDSPDRVEPETADDADVVSTEATDKEDRAQASARSEVVSNDELSVVANDVETKSDTASDKPQPDTTPDATPDESQSDTTPDATSDDLQPDTGAEPTDQPDGTTDTPPTPTEDTSDTAAETTSDTATGTASDREETPDGEVVQEPTDDDRPGLDELRNELNDQFESIRIINPGQYELNLMGLYDREEYIISLQEDGRYVIEVPDTWRDDE